MRPVFSGRCESLGFCIVFGLFCCLGLQRTAVGLLLCCASRRGKCQSFAVLDEQVLALELMSSLEASDILHRQVFLNALGTRRELWFWHGCSGAPTQFEYERYYGLGMDALLSVCSWNTKEGNDGFGMDALAVLRNSNTDAIMVWAWMLESHSCHGRRCSQAHYSILSVQRLERPMLLPLCSGTIP